MTEQEYLQRIHELEKQIARLQTEIKKNSETQYGLRWMDVPEAFEAEAENAIPTLEEVSEKAITNDDGKPTHILIEGDNFHALTCLNYTHKGQIDVIYIDPPYNTGSDGFVYKDKRVLDKFPDGTTVPTDHPLRHSYWLSFMHKRLELAKNLLSKKGVIYISLDDNELANLKLLCDQVFGEKNFVGLMTLMSNPRGSQNSKYLSYIHEYVLMYAKDKNTLITSGVAKEDEDLKEFKEVDESGRKYRLLGLRKRGGAWKMEDRPNMYYPIYVDPDTGTCSLYKDEQHVIEVIPKRPTGELSRWTWSKDKFNAEKHLLVGKPINRVGDADAFDVFRKDYIDNEEGEEKDTKLKTIWIEKETNYQNARNELKAIFGDSELFDYPKPTYIIKRLTSIIPNCDTILDFFGGSGTTMHATMQLNEEDGGHRQCILVQQNENNICEAVTYERNKRVMQGYTNAKGEAVAGLGNSMKYYRTAFVGEHKITDITDADKVALTQKAGCLLALGENNLEEIKTAKSYQIFQLRKGDKPTNDFEYTAVYFSGNLLHFTDFRREIEQIQEEHPLSRIAVYVFTWGDPSIFENEFDDLSGMTIKPIPQPILEIYQNIHQL